jgi:Rha family phage regulatory protein
LDKLSKESVKVMSNELTVINKDKAITSREVAEWTGKEHKNVIRDIEDELSKLINGGMEEYGKLNFELSSYKLATNTKPYPQYLLTKTGVQQIAMRYDAIIRAKVNLKLEELTSKPMSVIDMIIASAQQLKEQETRLQDVESKLAIVEAKQTNSPTDFYSVVAWCNLRHKKVTLREAQIYGRACSNLSSKLGVQTCSTPDPRFGIVKTYHADVLDEIVG